MNEKGNENLNNVENNVNNVENNNANNLNDKLDNNVFEPSKPVVLEPPKKTEIKEEPPKKTLFSKITGAHKGNQQQNNNEPGVKGTQEEAKKVTQEASSQNNAEDTKEFKEEIHDEIYYKNKSNKYFITLISFFAVLLLLFIVYYYFVMTPTKVFDDIINSLFDNIKEEINEFKNTSVNTYSVNFNTDISENNTKLEMLNDINIKTDIGFDVKKGNIYTQIIASKSNNPIFDTKLHLQDGKTYFQLPINDTNEEEKYVKLNLLNIENSEQFLTYDIRKLTSIYNVLEKTKDSIIDIIGEDDLQRKIVFKKIHDTTVVALKVNCLLSGEKVTNIYNKTFNRFINDNSVLEELENITGKDKETIRNILSKLVSEKRTSKNINVNLYTDLANTNLISLEVYIGDDYYFEFSNINGYYYFTLIKTENKKEVLNITGKYDIDNKIFTGEINIENNKTYSKVKYKYTDLDTKDNLMSGTIDLELYTDLSNDPVLKLNSVITSKENPTLDIPNLEKSYTLTDEEGYTVLSQEDLAYLSNQSDIIKEICETVKNLILNNK